MPTIEQLTAYAQVLLQKGLNLQKEQTLVINAPVEGHDFVTLLSKEAYTMGASEVVVNWRSDDMTRLRYEHEDLSSFESLPDWRRDFSLHYYHKKAAFLSLISANPKLLSGIDTKKIFAQQKAHNKALKEYIDGMMASKTPPYRAPSGPSSSILILTPTKPMTPFGTRFSNRQEPMEKIPWPTGTSTSRISKTAGRG